jgi:hypothetical protein
MTKTLSLKTVTLRGKGHLDWSKGVKEGEKYRDGDDDDDYDDDVDDE